MFKWKRKITSKKELEIKQRSAEYWQNQYSEFERKRHWCGHCVHGLEAAHQNHSMGTDKYYVCELLSPCEKFKRLPSETQTDGRKNEG